MLGLNGDAKYSSSYWSNQAENPLSRQKRFWLIGAGVRLKSTQGWELAFVGRNLTNKYYQTFTSDRPGGSADDIYGAPNRARELKVQASFTF